MPIKRRNNLICKKSNRINKIKSSLLMKISMLNNNNNNTGVIEMKIKTMKVYKIRKIYKKNNI